jgi:hypothetical protein
MTIYNNSETLVVCFGGMALKFGYIPPFEFLNHLTTIYHDSIDMMFFIDKHLAWYHKGIDGLTTNIKETVEHLDNIIKKGNYKKVIFMGVSAGGYAAILFGSLCKVNYVVTFIARTLLHNPIDKEYGDLKKFINPSTYYILYGDLSIMNRTDPHHCSQCDYLDCFDNVKVIRKEKVHLKTMRDNGEIKSIIDALIK